MLAMVLTLASPHLRPPLPAHPSLARAYHARHGSPTPAVPLVSLSGDYNDTQVASALTSVQGEWQLLVLMHKMLNFNLVHFITHSCFAHDWTTRPQTPGTKHKSQTG